VNFRAIRGRLLGRKGLEEQAERAGREAVAMADATESLDVQASARVDLAFVLRDRESEREAKTVIREALALYKQKGNLVEQAKAQALLAS
jgi:hypothetical protein